MFCVSPVSLHNWNSTDYSNSVWKPDYTRTVQYFQVTVEFHTLVLLIQIKATQLFVELFLKDEACMA